MDRMGSKCEISNTLHVAKWETPPVRSKLDVSGGSPLPTLSPGSCAPPRVHAPIDIAELPLESSFEPPSPSPKQSAGHQVGGKILKFLKLRKKSNSETTISQETFRPSLTTFRFQDQSKRFASVEDVDLERYHYDSDEHSESVSTSGANNCGRHHHRSSCSASSDSASSSRSSQSFSSMTSRSSVTPRASFILAAPGHQSGAQLMANILISISNLDEDDELGYECDHPPALDGPHESAWHQPRDEMFAAPLGAGRHSSAAKPNSGRNTPRLGRCSIDLHLTSPGPSRRFGKLDLSRIDKLR